jgi:hypothetical protein
MTGVEVWSSPEWWTLAVSWLDEQLAAAGIERTGDVTQPHLERWGTALRAPTSRGPMWLKAPGPATAFEVGLYPLLARVTPEWVLPPLAADVGRGWILLPDGGITLGDRLGELDLVETLVKVLPQYGQFQRDLTPHVGSLLSFGIADMRPEVMPRRFDEAVATVRATETARRVAAMRDTFVSWCEELETAAAAPSLDHNDLHPWNIFHAATEPVRFYDWGDSVVAHPFASMLVALGFVREQLGDDAILRPRDAYLEVFSDLAPHGELVAEMELACRVAKIARVLTWARAVGGRADEPLRSLEALLADSSLALSLEPVVAK